MYEHPIKRAGLTFNRMLFSNTKMVWEGFPNVTANRFEITYRFRTYENGKQQTSQCRFLTFKSFRDRR